MLNPAAIVTPSACKPGSGLLPRRLATADADPRDIAAYLREKVMIVVCDRITWTVETGTESIELAK